MKKTDKELLTLQENINNWSRILVEVTILLYSAFDQFLYLETDTNTYTLYH